MAMRWVYRIGIASFGLLLVSGVYLYFAYQPQPPAGQGDERPTLAQVAPVVHWVTAVGFVASLVALAALYLGHKPRFATIITFAVAIGLGYFAFRSGANLDWDMIALSTVTVGDTVAGLDILFDDRMLFALVDGAEVSTGSLRRTLALHLVQALAALSALLVVSPRRQL